MLRIACVMLLAIMVAVPGAAPTLASDREASQAIGGAPSVRTAGCWRGSAFHVCYLAILSADLATVFAQASTRWNMPHPITGAKLALLITDLHRQALGESISPIAAQMLAPADGGGSGGFIGIGGDTTMVKVTREEYDAFHRWWARPERGSLSAPFPPALPLDDLFADEYPVYARHNCVYPTPAHLILSEQASYGCYESRASAGLLTFVLQATDSPDNIAGMPLATNHALRLMRWLHRPPPAEAASG